MKRASSILAVIALICFGLQSLAVGLTIPEANRKTDGLGVALGGSDWMTPDTFAASNVSTSKVREYVARNALVVFSSSIEAGDVDRILANYGAEPIRKTGLPEYVVFVRFPGDDVAYELAQDAAVVSIYPATEAMIDDDGVYTYSPDSRTSTGASRMLMGFTVQGDGWDGPGRGAVTLTYCFDNATADISTELQRSEIRRAVNTWANPAAIFFTETTTPHLQWSTDFLFTSGAHGDIKPFDGPGGTLGHALYPPPLNDEPGAGDVHFDDADTFAVGTGNDLYSIALHEIGHSLGLDHSSDAASVMYPVYRAGTVFTNLTQDDIDGLLSLYCAKSEISNNDQCTGAVAILALPYNAAQSTNTATIIGDPTCSLGEIGASVWYRFTSPYVANIRVDTVGSDFDTILAVYTGTCGALTELAASDDYGTLTQSSLIFPAVAGTTYYVQVGGSQRTHGSLALHLDYETTRITSISPSSDVEGATVAISGTAFTGATHVRFNGLDANFTVQSPTLINAVVPTGATTGPVSVTTPAGIAVSPNDFIVLPKVGVKDTDVSEPRTGTVDAVFTISLSKASAAVVLVNYATANGTALAGSDYAAKTGTVVFPAGTVTQTVVVKVNADALSEGYETFKLNLTAASNARLTVNQATCTIADPDLPPKLMPTDGIAYSNLGHAVAVTADTIMASAPPSDAVYVFVRSGASWIEQARLVPSDSNPGNAFGTSLAIDGDTMVIGSPDDTGVTGSSRGAVYVFSRASGVWTQSVKLQPAGTDGEHVSYGSAVAISGSTIVVGDVSEKVSGVTSAGSVYVYTGSGTSWVQQARLTAGDGDTSDNFGCSVSVSGDKLAVGKYFAGTDNSGAAYVFTKSGSVWTQQQKLTAASTSVSSGFLGYSVSIKGNTLAVTSMNTLGSVYSYGYVYVFRYNGSSWNQESRLASTTPVYNAALGGSTALDGDIAVAGASGDTITGLSYSGCAYVFTRDGTTWNQLYKLNAPDAGANDRFGWSVALYGRTAVVGSPKDDYSGVTDAGSVYVFDLTPGNLYANDPPVVSVPGAQIALEETPFAISGIAVTDIDVGSGDIQISLSALQGTITLGIKTGLAFTTGDGTADANMVFRGKIEIVNAALATVSYQGNVDFFAADTISVTADDLGNTGFGGPTTCARTIAISVNAVNDAPVITAPTVKTAYRDSDTVFNGVSITDSDLGTGNMELTLSALHGVFSLNSTTRLTFSSGDGKSDASIVFQGKLTDVLYAIINVVYRPTAGYSGPDTFTISANDLGNTGAGGAKTSVRSIQITVENALARPLPYVMDEFTTGLTGSQLQDMVLEPASRQLYVYRPYTGIVVVNAMNGSTNATIAGGYVTTLGVNSITRKVYSNNLPSGTLGVIDTTTNTVTAGAGLYMATMVGVAVNETTNTIYCGDYVNVMAIVDGYTNNKTTLILPDTVTQNFTVNPVANLVYVTRHRFTGEDSFYIVNGATKSLAYTLNYNVGEIAVNPLTNRLYMCGGNSILVANGANGALITTIPLGRSATGISVNTWANRVYVANATESTITVINGETNEIEGFVPLISGYLTKIAVDPSAGRLYVLNTGQNYTPSKVTVLSEPTTNGPLYVNVQGALGVDEDTDLTVSGVSISDANVGSGSVQVTLSVTRGVLTVGNRTGISFTAGDGTADSTMTFSGTLSAVNAGLGSLVYRGGPELNGWDELIITGREISGTALNTRLLKIVVYPVNDAPVLTVPGPQIENKSPHLSLSSVTVADPDSGQKSMHLAVSALHGNVWTAGSTPARTYALDGYLSSINTKLSQLCYRGDSGYSGPDTITITVSDGGWTGSGGVKSDTKTVDVTVTFMPAPQFTITDLGSFDSNTSTAYAINDLGHVVGYSSPSGTGFIWKPETGLVSLGTGVTPIDINNSDQICGYKSDGSFRWTAGTFKNLCTTTSQATGINDNGEVCGWWYTSSIYYPWIYGTSFAYMTNADMAQGQPAGINNSKQVTGTYYNKTGTQSWSGLLYENGALTKILGTPYAINNSGMVVGYGFRWRNGVLTDLGMPNGCTGSSSLGVNDSGAIVGKGSVSGGTYIAAYYQDGVGMVNLNDLIPSGSGWTLTGAVGINKYHQIVGTGTIGGKNRAFLLTPSSTIIDAVSCQPSVVAPGDMVVVTVSIVSIATVTGVTADGIPLSNSGAGVWSGSIVAAPEPGPHAVNVVVTVSGGPVLYHSLSSYTTGRVAGTIVRSLYETAAENARNWCIFLVCGRATRIDADNFSVNDGSVNASGSPVTITVHAPGHGVTNGVLVRARGVLELGTTSRRLETTADHVVIL